MLANSITLKNVKVFNLADCSDIMTIDVKENDKYYKFI